MCEDLVRTSEAVRELTGPRRRIRVRPGEFPRTADAAVIAWVRDRLRSLIPLQISVRPRTRSATAAAQGAPRPDRLVVLPVDLAQF